MTDEQETNHAFARSRSNAGLGDHKCPKCSGMCSVRKFADFENGYENGYWMDCPTCKGTGRVDAETLDRTDRFFAQYQSPNV